MSDFPPELLKNPPVPSVWLHIVGLAIWVSFMGLVIYGTDLEAEIIRRKGDLDCAPWRTKCVESTMEESYNGSQF